MFELLTIIVFIWLFCQAMKLIFKITWGAAKVAAVLLMVIALPVLIGSLLFAGGLLLLIPIAIVGLACGILKACI